MSKRSAASVLKAKGLIPKSWDLRKPLSEYKRKQVSKLSKEFSEVVKRPGEFATRKVNAKAAKLLTDSGYKVKRDRWLLRVSDDRKTHLDTRRGVLTIQRTRREGERVIETVYLGSHKSFLKRVDEFSDDDLEANEYWAFKVGDNNTFVKSHQSLALLMRYGTTINWTDPGAKDYVSLVKVKFDPSSFKQAPMSDQERGNLGQKKASRKKGRGNRPRN